MNQPDDHYGAVIRERTAAEAADDLADECRKKDQSIAALRRALEEASNVADDMAETWDDFDAALVRQPHMSDAYQFTDSPRAWAKFHPMERAVMNWQLGDVRKQIMALLAVPVDAGRALPDWTADDQRRLNELVAYPVNKTRDGFFVQMAEDQWNWTRDRLAALARLAGGTPPRVESE